MPIYRSLFWTIAVGVRSQSGGIRSRESASRPIESFPSQSDRSLERRFNRIRSAPTFALQNSRSATFLLVKTRAKRKTSNSMSLASTKYCHFRQLISFFDNASVRRSAENAKKALGVAFERRKQDAIGWRSLFNRSFYHLKFVYFGLAPSIRKYFYSSLNYRNGTWFKTQTLRSTAIIKRSWQKLNLSSGWFSASPYAFFVCFTKILARVD